ncbi:hypothetical protein AC249_AIPGENE4983 [Exaiptasia diaphana]|nr:hypothetical protein AC249_AIPGENE4983 [Exaiptasia diaphana]
MTWPSPKRSRIEEFIVLEWKKLRQKGKKKFFWASTGKMLFLGAVSLSLVVICLAEGVWDPTDPKCEAERQRQKNYWDTEVLGQAYGWINQFGRHSLFLVLLCIFYLFELAPIADSTIP